MDGGRIDKISPVPYYYQLEQLLREKIEKGKGTFVAKPKLQEKFIQRTYGFYEEMKRRKPPHRENSTFWSGIPSKQTVSFSDRTDK